MAVTKLGLTRDQLASFLSDFEQIKQFEKLFSSVDNVVNVDLDSVNISAGNAEASANEALDAIARIKALLDPLSVAPVIENNNSVTTDYIDYRSLAPQPLPLVGRTFWNGGTTLNVQHTLNVAGKVNEDNFYYIKASAAITKGQLVMFTGSVGSSGVLTGAPASTALGVNDGVRLMGIAAENLALNAFGLVQWSGVLRGFNTTGSAYGETWADGDILYYNPAYTGGLTNVEPTAPNVRAIIAAVVTAGSGGSGSVAIRITAGSVLGGTDSNVYINGLADGDVLQYSNANQRWENTPASSVSSGTYTPTLTNVTNVAASTAYSTAYSQVGSTVNLGGRVQIDPTATGSISIRMSLPVASNFGAISDAGGTFISGNTGIFGAISADITNDDLVFTGQATVTAATNCFFNVTYTVI